MTQIKACEHNLYTLKTQKLIEFTFNKFDTILISFQVQDKLKRV